MCGYPRGVLGVTFCFVLTAGITTCLPIQTINEILRKVETEDGLLRADLERLYAFSHKSWHPHVVNNEVSTELELTNRDPRYYMPVLDTYMSENNQTNATTESGEKKDVDPWSLIWYMASFGGLVTFFLVVSCSECCCSKRTARNINTSPRSVETEQEETQWVEETPPPPYHLFAPPSYDTLFYGTKDEKNMCEVYVVPIHNHRATLQNGASSASVAPT